jgi:hypothetical protein
MTREQMEWEWQRPGVRCEKHVACWDDFGKAHRGKVMNTEPGKSAVAFRALIKKMNRNANT